MLERPCLNSEMRLVRVAPVTALAVLTLSGALLGHLAGATPARLASNTTAITRTTPRQVAETLAEEPPIPGVDKAIAPVHGVVIAEGTRPSIEVSESLRHVPPPTVRENTRRTLGAIPPDGRVEPIGPAMPLGRGVIVTRVRTVTTVPRPRITGGTPFGAVIETVPRTATGGPAAGTGAVGPVVTPPV